MTHVSVCKDANRGVRINAKKDIEDGGIQDIAESRLTLKNSGVWREKIGEGRDAQAEREKKKDCQK